MTNDNNNNNNNDFDFDTLVNAGAMGNGAYITSEDDILFLTSYKGDDYAEAWERTDGNWFGVASGNLADAQTLGLIRNARGLVEIHREEIQANIKYYGLSLAAATLKANAAHDGLMRTMENGTVFIDTDFISITD